MITMNFLLFLSVLELVFILFVIAIVLAFYVKKYRPYYMANTRPDAFLRKYLQRLIKQTRAFASGFEKAAADGDMSAYRTRQNMAARLNWLVLERDFATTIDPDIRYWEDINHRIKEMLLKWKEVEIIKEPPDIEIIKLAIDKDHGDGIGSTAQTGGGATDAAMKEAKAEISELKKRLKTMAQYESMSKEMELAYQTLDDTYNELKSSLKDLELEAGEAEKLRDLLKQQEAQEASLGAMMDEMEASKERLTQELAQLEQAYDALEEEAIHNKPLNTSNNDDAKDILDILNQQEDLLNGLKDSVKNLRVNNQEKEPLINFTNKIEQSNKEVNHSMQMLELERERLSEEVEKLQEQSAIQSSIEDDFDESKA